MARTHYALVRWAPNPAFRDGAEYLAVEHKSGLLCWGPDEYELLCDDRPKHELKAMRRLLEKCNDKNP